MRDPGGNKLANGTFSTYDYPAMTLLIVSPHKVGRGGLANSGTDIRTSAQLQGDH